MTIRVAGNWLRAYVGYTAELETSDNFHIWTGLSVIASAARRNVWLNQGHFLLYPNLYVILVGPPGDGKSTAIRAGRKLLIQLPEIFFGPDSLTREEMIAIMAKISEKEVTKSAAMTLHSNELASLIEPSGMHMISLLTELYDCDDTFKYSTKHQGKDVVRRPCLNINAGTTPSWIAENLPARTVGHGYLSRNIFVYEDEKRFLNPRPKEPPKQITEALVEDLKHIATLRGEFTYADGAIEKYDYLYRKIYSTRPKDYRLSDFHARKGKTHLLKTAMLLSMAERDDLTLHPQDLDTAYQLLNGLEARMYKAFSGVGKYEHASDMERILEDIERAGEMSAAEIHEQNYAVGDIEAIARILQMLERMGRVKSIMKDVPGVKGKVIYYKSVNGKSSSNVPEKLI